MEPRCNGQQYEKFRNNFKSILKTSELMAVRINEIKALHEGIKSNLEKLHSLTSEVNAIAVKWGIEPIPNKGIPLKFEKQDDIQFSMPQEARE